MPASTEKRKATKKTKSIKLVGVDLFLFTEGSIPKFDDIGPFKCEFISKRGTKAWPGFVRPDLPTVSRYRCRFMATRDVQDADVNSFLDALTKRGEVWSAVQKLWNNNGGPRFSKAD